MTVLIRTEIAAALNSHRLASAQGWRGDDGVVVYSCACGQRFDADPRVFHFVSTAAMLAEHQAEIIDRLGFSRGTDAYDEVAFAGIVDLLAQRKSLVEASLAAARRCDSLAEQQRLDGALTELSILLEAVGQLVGIRLADGQVELPIDEKSLALV